jgi:hypothetical protein
MATVDRSFPVLRLLDIGRRQGSVTIGELNRLLPIGNRDIDAADVLDTLRSRGVSIVLTRSPHGSGDFHLLNDDRVVYPL